MFKVWLVVLALATRECALQEQDGPYRGKFIGALNTYHHQVSGEVYAVDDWTLLLVNFNYDGTGDDTFFWAGDAVRPGPQGFIVPDQHGKTNILERYINAEVRLRLPEGKRVSRLKWLSVYDVDSQNSFGDVFVPDEFSPPAPRALPALAGAALSSRPLQILTATTFLIPEFKYDGSGGEVYFWTGVGPQPSPKGMKIPDEDGYLEPLRVYRGEDVRLTLAGGLTVFDVTWLAVYDVTARAALASVLLPEGLNVPPSAHATHPYESKMPHCKQLHRDYQVSWEVFGPQVTFELAGQIEVDEYMAWGRSGSRARSEMVGADVAVARYSEELRQAFVQDYNISAKAPCVRVLDRPRGVCRDDALGGVNSYQLFMSRREEALTVVTFRRNLKPDEAMDLEWSVETPQFVVWAVGALGGGAAGGGGGGGPEPALHRLYHKADLQLQLQQPPAENDCFKFTLGAREAVVPWETAQLFDPALRVFRRGGSAPRLVRQRTARARPAAAPRPAVHIRGVRRQQPSLGDGVPPAGDHRGARGGAGAAGGGGAASRARAGRRALHAAGPPHAHACGSAVRGRAARGRGRAPGRRLPDLPRVQPLAELVVRGGGRRGRGRGGGAARHAQLLVARRGVLPLLHALRYGRTHIHSRPPQAQPRPEGSRLGRGCRPLARTRTGRRARRCSRLARTHALTHPETDSNYLIFYTISEAAQMYLMKLFRPM